MSAAATILTGRRSSRDLRSRGRAQSPGYVSQGLGTDYIRYDWSACAMLMVMHYFGGAPFKRIESLHEGWGVPMPDANQWEVVNAGDDLLLPLYRALERHAIQKATNFRETSVASAACTRAPR